MKNYDFYFEPTSAYAALTGCEKITNHLTTLMDSLNSMSGDVALVGGECYSLYESGYNTVVEFHNSFVDLCKKYTTYLYTMMEDDPEFSVALNYLFESDGSIDNDWVDKEWNEVLEARKNENEYDGDLTSTYTDFLSIKFYCDAAGKPVNYYSLELLKKEDPALYLDVLEYSGFQQFLSEKGYKDTCLLSLNDLHLQYKDEFKKYYKDVGSYFQHSRSIVEFSKQNPYICLPDGNFTLNELSDDDRIKYIEWTMLNSDEYKKVISDCGFSNIHTMADLNRAIKSVEYRITELHALLDKCNEMVDEGTAVITMIDYVNVNYNGYCSDFKKIADECCIGYTYKNANGKTVFVSDYNSINIYSLDDPSSVKSIYFLEEFGETQLFKSLADKFSDDPYYATKFYSADDGLYKKAADLQNTKGNEKKSLENELQKQIQNKNTLQYLYKDIPKSSKNYYDTDMAFTFNDDYSLYSVKDNAKTKDVDSKIKELCDYYSYTNLNDAGFYVGDNENIFLDSSGSNVYLHVNDKDTLNALLYALINDNDNDNLIVNDNTICFQIPGAADGEYCYIESNDPMLKDFLLWAPLMSDGEKRAYLYNYNKNGADAGYNYLKNASDMLDNRYVDKKLLADQEYAEKYPGRASAKSVLYTPIEGLLAAGYSLTTLMTGNEIRQSHVYSSGDTYRQTVAANIESPGWSFLYSTGMSMADSAVLLGMNALTMGTMTPFLSVTLMGSRSYVSTLNDALDRGLSDGQAVALAFSSAAAESVCETVSVGSLMNLDSSLNSVLGNALKNIDNPILKNVTKVLGGALIQGVSEGQEELCTELVNNLVDNLISGELSHFSLSVAEKMNNGYSEEEAIAMTSQENLEQLGLAFLGGFISGGVNGGVFSTANVAGDAIKNSVNVNAIANNIMNEFNKIDFDIDPKNIRKNIRNGNFPSAVSIILDNKLASPAEKLVAANALVDSINKSSNMSSEQRNKINSMLDSTLKEFLALDPETQASQFAKLDTKNQVYLHKFMDTESFSKLFDKLSDDLKIKFLQESEKSDGKNDKVSDFTAPTETGVKEMTSVDDIVADVVGKIKQNLGESAGEINLDYRGVLPTANNDIFLFRDEIQLFEYGNGSVEGYNNVFHLVDKDGNFVGSIKAIGSSKQMTNKVELEYIIDPAYQGKGYASAALDMVVNDIFSNGILNGIEYKKGDIVIPSSIETITLSIEDFNVASKKVAQKNGFINNGGESYILTKSDWLLNKDGDISNDANSVENKNQEDNQVYEGGVKPNIGIQFFAGKGDTNGFTPAGDLTGELTETELDKVTAGAPISGFTPAGDLDTASNSKVSNIEDAKKILLRGIKDTYYYYHGKANGLKFIENYIKSGNPNMLGSAGTFKQDVLNMDRNTLIECYEILHTNAIESAKKLILNGIEDTYYYYHGKVDGLKLLDDYLKTENPDALGSAGTFKQDVLNMDYDTLFECYKILSEEAAKKGSTSVFKLARDLDTASNSNGENNVGLQPEEKKVSKFGESYNYSDYSLEQINEWVPNYQEICDLFISTATDSNLKAKLEQILYQGGYDGYSLASKKSSKDSPVIEMNRRLSMARLLVTNPDTFDIIVKNGVNLFHGTNSKALPNIFKYGLNSFVDLNNQNISVETGETWSGRAGRGFISFTDVFNVASNYSRMIPTDNSFEVIIGTSVDEAKNSVIFSPGSDVPEVGLRKKLPLDKIKVICVPSAYVDYVKNLLPNNSIQVLPFDVVENSFYYFDEESYSLDIDRSDFDKLKETLSSNNRKHSGNGGNLFTPAGDLIGELTEMELDKVTAGSPIPEFTPTIELEQLRIKFSEITKNGDYTTLTTDLTFKERVELLVDYFREDEISFEDFFDVPASSKILSYSIYSNESFQQNLFSDTEIEFILSNSDIYYEIIKYMQFTFLDKVINLSDGKKNQIIETILQLDDNILWENNKAKFILSLNTDGKINAMQIIKRKGILLDSYYESILYYLDEDSVMQILTLDNDLSINSSIFSNIILKLTEENRMQLFDYIDDVDYRERLFLSLSEDNQFKIIQNSDLTLENNSFLHYYRHKFTEKVLTDNMLKSSESNKVNIKQGVLDVDFLIDSEVSSVIEQIAKNNGISNQINMNWFNNFYNLFSYKGVSTKQLNKLINLLLSKDNIGNMNKHFLQFSNVSSNRYNASSYEQFFDYLSSIDSKIDNLYLETAIEYILDNINNDTNVIDLFIKYVAVTNFDDIRYVSNLSNNLSKLNNGISVSCFDLGINPISIKLGNFELAYIGEITLDNDYIYIDKVYTRENLTGIKLGTVMFEKLFGELNFIFPGKNVCVSPIKYDNFGGMKFYETQGGQLYQLGMNEYEKVSFSEYDISKNFGQDNLIAVYDANFLKELSMKPIEKPVIKLSNGTIITTVSDKIITGEYANYSQEDVYIWNGYSFPTYIVVSGDYSVPTQLLYDVLNDKKLNRKIFEDEIDYGNYSNFVIKEAIVNIYTTAKVQGVELCLYPLFEDRIKDYIYDIKYKLNETVKDFIISKNIDSFGILNLGDMAEVKTPDELNKLVSDYGMYHKKEDTMVSVGDILGGDYFFDNILFSLGRYFDKNGSGYEKRSVSLLEQYDNGAEMLLGLEQSFIREEIDIKEVLPGKYVIANNGLHRYTALRIHYLNEFLKTGSDIDRSKLKEKYMIPVCARKIDYVKTYSNFILRRLDTNVEYIYSNCTRDSEGYSVQTDLLDIVYKDGTTVTLNDEQLIVLVRDILVKSMNDKKNPDYFVWGSEYDYKFGDWLVEKFYNSDVSFKNFVDKIIN